MKAKIFWYNIGILFLIFVLSSCTVSESKGEEIFIQSESLQNETITNEDILPEIIEQEEIILDDKIILENEIQENSNKEFILEGKSNDLEKYISVNEDFAGIIKIDNTLIDLPVVKAGDNDFYLRRDFNKNSDRYGSIFMDYRNFGSGFDKNIIIYGHNMKDDKMFGQLRNYMDESYINNHTIVTFQDLYTTRKYQVFSTYFADSDGSLITTSFSDTSFSDYLETIQNLSKFNLNVDVTNEDNIITLVTCSYDVDDGRYFVHAVEITD